MRVYDIVWGRWSNTFLRSLNNELKVLHENSYNFRLSAQLYLVEAWVYTFFGQYLCLSRAVSRGKWLLDAEPDQVDESEHAGWRLFQRKMLIHRKTRLICGMMEFRLWKDHRIFVTKHKVGWDVTITKSLSYRTKEIMAGTWLNSTNDVLNNEVISEIIALRLNNSHRSLWINWRYPRSWQG